MHAHQASTAASRRCARGAREHGALTAQAVRMQPTRHRRHKSTVAILIGTVCKKKLWKHAVIIIIFNISKVLVENKYGNYNIWFIFCTLFDCVGLQPFGKKDRTATSICIKFEFHQVPKKVKLITCFHDSWIYESRKKNHKIFFVLFFYKVELFYWDQTCHYNCLS